MAMYVVVSIFQRKYKISNNFLQNSVFHFPIPFLLRPLSLICSTFFVSSSLPPLSWRGVDKTSPFQWTALNAVFNLPYFVTSQLGLTIRISTALCNLLYRQSDSIYSYLYVIPLSLHVIVQYNLDQS